MQLQLTNVINISVSEAQAGIGDYNTSNLGLFTHEVPADSFGDDGFKPYIDPIDVGVDFGTGSRTYEMALAVFSQQPNILAGDGQLIVVLMNGAVSPVTAVQTITPSSVPTTGTYKLHFGAASTSALAANATAADIQTALRLLSGLSTITVAGTLATHVTVTMTGVTPGPVANLTVLEDSLQDTSGFNVFLTVATTVVGVATATAERGRGAHQRFGAVFRRHGKRDRFGADRGNHACGSGGHPGIE